MYSLLMHGPLSTYRSPHTHPHPPHTGSGKTYTMFGAQGEEAGIIPRAVTEVFDAIAAQSRQLECAVVVSFLEMYCDRIRDLGRAYLDSGKASGAKQSTAEWFRSASQRTSFATTRADATARMYASENLQVHEDTAGNVFVRDLTLIPAASPEEVLAVVQAGFQLRATHETRMNSVSSRSHTVLTLHVLQRDAATGETITGMLNMIDLAGSERLARSQSTGQRLTEAMAINSSLSALGKVVMSLQQDQSAQHVPYRDSKLTRILQNSLGGNSFTVLLAAVHPREEDVDESISTLQFATRCQQVINQPRANVGALSEEDKSRRIVVLEAENAALRRHLVLERISSDMRAACTLRDAGVTAHFKPDGAIVSSVEEVLVHPVAIFRETKYATTAADRVAALISVQRSSTVEQLLKLTTAHVDDLPIEDMYTTLLREVHTAAGHRRLAKEGGLGGARRGGKGDAGDLSERADELGITSMHKARIRELKQQLATFTAKYDSEVHQLRRQLAAAKAQASEAQARALKAERKRDADVDYARTLAKQQADSILANSRRLAEEADSALASLPVLVAQDGQAQLERERMCSSIAADAQLRTDTLVARTKLGAHAEIQMIQSKFTAFKSNVAAQRAKLVQQFEAERADLTLHVAELETELAQLFDYTHQLSNIIADVREGVFPIIHSDMAPRLRLPAGVLPICPLPQATARDSLMRTSDVGDRKAMPHLRRLLREAQLPLPKLVGKPVRSL